jgi:bifunctional oligoribonuclease and PAP phosphatase NrnA
MSLRKAAECVRKNNSFVITAHLNAEGDAFGAELALFNLLKKLGKRAVIINDDPLPDEYAFMPGIKRIKRFSPALKKINFDCFAVVDCSDISRCGKVSDIYTQGKMLLNIDHHISNSYFGKVNWVEPAASSASEMIYLLFKEMRVPLDKETAKLLYVGILTDTGSFHYSNTNAGTHRVAADLLEYGLAASRIYKDAYSNLPFPQMKILGNLLTKIKCDASGRIIWLVLNNGREVLGAGSFDLSEYLLTLMRSIKGAEVVVLFRDGYRRKGEVRVNFRSEGKADVNKVSGFFGGGGHKAASGCTIKGSLQDAERAVLRKIKEVTGWR